MLQALAVAYLKRELKKQAERATRTGALDYRTAPKGTEYVVKTGWDFNVSGRDVDVIVTLKLGNEPR